MPLKTSETSSKTEAEDSENKTKITLTIDKPYFFGVLLKLGGQLLVWGYGSDPRAGSQAQDDQNDN